MAGTSYAATQIGSSQIKNNSVKGKDVKDGNLTGKDVKDASINSSLTGADIQDGSLTKADLPAVGCAADAFRLATGCLIKATRSVGTINSALTDCNSLGGRLPSLEETKLAAAEQRPGRRGDLDLGALNNYEFTGEFVDSTGLKVVATDFSGNVLFEDGFAIQRGHHCVVMPS